MENLESQAQFRAIITKLTGNEVAAGIAQLRTLKDKTHAGIPDNRRQSRGITWVLQQISAQMVEACAGDLEQVKTIAYRIHEHLAREDILQGVSSFLMAAYGKEHPGKVYEFFETAAGSENWVVREFAAAGFHKVIAAQPEIVRPWLMEKVHSKNPNVRRFVSESLRPVTDLRWINQQPEYSLGVLRQLFHEAHPYPRTSVGNNLSDLSRRQPELILSVVEELVEMGDENSTWIAHRACRNLVKKYPERVLDTLGVNEFHYKDRHYYRK